MRFQRPEKAYLGYIFDCDGTLADSMPHHYIAWCAAMHRFARKAVFPEDRFYDLGGKHASGIVQMLNDEFGDDMPVEEVVEFKENYYKDHVDDIQPIPEVVSFAKELKAAGKPIAVATGGTHDVVNKTLKTIGLDGFFEHIVTSKCVARGKPAPDIYLLAAEKIGVQPDNCLVLEDTITGEQGAKAAGMDCILIKRA